MTSPKLISRIDEMTAVVNQKKADGQRVGLVPTMGYLHDGHLSLVQTASQNADCVVVSIYVNPTQFGPNEDLDVYPRDFQGDMNKLAELGVVTTVFLPKDNEIYPAGFSTKVVVDHLTTGLCGASRPTHFAGVTTVVTKLFNIVRPDVAVFGEKDYQQLAVIRRMVRDLNLSTEIIGAPTVRESDDLAMSSRNAYLTPQQRQAAPTIIRALRHIKQRYQDGQRDGRVLVEEARQMIEGTGVLTVDYLDLVDPDELRRLVTETHFELPDRVHVAAAVFAGKTRLIDNLRVSG